MVDILYTLIDFICIFILQVILYRTKYQPFYKGKTKFKDKAFIKYLSLASFMCLTDAFWGSMASHQLAVGLNVFKALTGILNIFFCIIPFSWFFYVETNRENFTEQPKKIILLTFLPVVITIVLNIVNFWTGSMYVIERNLVIYPGPLLFIPISTGIAYYTISMIYMLVSYGKTKDKEIKKRYLVIAFYSLILIVFTLLQFFLNDGPFSALGYMIAGFAVYIFNNSKEKENLLIDFHETENLLKLEKNEMVTSTIANMFIVLLSFEGLDTPPQKIKGGELFEDSVNNISDPKMIFSETLKKYVHPDYLEEMILFTNRASVRQRLEGAKSISKDFLSKDSGWCRAIWASVKEGDDEKSDTVLFGVRVIDKDKKRELEYQQKLKLALKNQNEIFGEMLQMQSNGMLATDMHNKILMMNDAAAKIFGFSNSGSVNEVEDLFIKVDMENKEEIRAKLRKIKMNGGKYAFEFSVTDLNGNLIHYIAESKLTHLSNGDKVVLTSFADITKNKKMERDLVILSETDALTGISNRGSGERKIEYLLSTGKSGMLCILDADKFKSINDNYGHVVGDRVIIKIAESLKKTFRDRDIIMRLGGDEFAVFAVGIVEEKDAKLCLQRFFENVDDIQIPEMGEKRISVSLGIVLCTDVENKSFDDYYQMADRAMYVSKKYDGNHFEFCRTMEK